MRFSGISISVVVIAALGFANIGEAKIGAGNDDDSFGKDRALKGGSKPEYIEYSGSENRDITMREGHGENYGIPGIEYLGCVLYLYLSKDFCLFSLLGLN